MTARRVSPRAGSAQRPLSRAERGNLEQRLARMPADRAEAFRRLQDHPGGRARLRDAGYVSRPDPVPAPSGRTRLHGVEVDLDRIVAELRRSEPGRAALRRRGIET